MTKNEYLTLVKIADRACEMSSILKNDRIGLLMDLEYTNDEMPLDFDLLLSFNDFDFKHDIYGIASNFHRPTKTMLNCFVPRCVKHD